jgi:hypothetical protein
MLGEAAVGHGAGGLDLLDLLVDLLQRLPERFDQLADRLLAQLQVPLRRLLELLQGRLGQVEEARVVVLERLRGHGLEGVGEPRLGVSQQAQPLGGGLALFLDGGPEHGGGRTHQEPDEPASQHEGDDRHEKREVHGVAGV